MTEVPKSSKVELPPLPAQRLRMKSASRRGFLGVFTSWHELPENRYMYAGTSFNTPLEREA